jgi:hypothetical protein
MPIDFSNKSQLGAFGEFVYKKYCESLGFGIERTNYCHTDFVLETNNTKQPQYVDVKASVKDKSKYSGTRYHDKIAYELMLFLENEIFLCPDQNSPLHNKGRHSLGSIAEWLSKWEKNTEIVRKRAKRIDAKTFKELKKLFSKSQYSRLRIVERGDASGKRWTGTVDNLPGSHDVIGANDVTLFMEFGCENFQEKLSKIYLIWHHFIQGRKIRMSKPNNMQIKKGITEVVDLKAFISDYPELVFENLDDLNSYIKNNLSH